MWPERYAKDMERARNRVRAVPSAHIETPFDGLEYAQRGTGAPVLMSHGIWGSHAEGIGMVPTYIGDGYSSVAPSRFGYFGTALPPKAAPADQADAHLYLLDHLQIDRAVAVGYSAGSASLSSLRYAIPIGPRADPDRGTPAWASDAAASDPADDASRVPLGAHVLGAEVSDAPSIQQAHRGAQGVGTDRSRGEGDP
ncbi:MAG TPA: hypothetical protein VI094_08190 [Propionibacteriaceae bacterium]